MQIRGAVPQEAFAGELPQGVTCVGISTSVGVLTAAFIDEAVAPHCSRGGERVAGP